MGLIIVILVTGIFIIYKFWGPGVLGGLNDTERASNVESVTKVFSPSGKYYAVQSYVKSEWVTCCGNDETFEKMVYKVGIYESETDGQIKEFIEFNYDGYMGYTPVIDKWELEDVLQMIGVGIVDAFRVQYDISEDKVIPEWEIK